MLKGRGVECRARPLQQCDKFRAFTICWIICFEPTFLILNSKSQGVLVCGNLTLPLFTWINMPRTPSQQGHWQVKVLFHQFQGLDFYSLLIGFLTQCAHILRALQFFNLSSQQPHLKKKKKELAAKRLSSLSFRSERQRLEPHGVPRPSLLGQEFDLLLP